MNKILIQKNNDKFINNLELTNITFAEKIVKNTSGCLYKTYFNYKFSHLVLIYSLLTQEELQFIDDFSSSVCIYVYNDINDNIQTKYNIHSILQYNKNISPNNITIIPTLVNNELFNNKLENHIKNNQIVSFLDKLTALPEELNNYLYPQNKLQIKLFNNDKIIHPQNLGLVSEKDKADILKSSKYYLAITEDYIPEAWACDCKVLTISELSSMKSEKFKHSKQYQSYSNFLKVLCCD